MKPPAGPYCPKCEEVLEELPCPCCGWMPPQDREGYLQNQADSLHASGYR